MPNSDFRVLYYPAYEPDMTWLKSNLLMFDQVTRIVPKDANHIDSTATQELNSALPDALTIYSPDADDITIESQFLRPLDRAFEIIAAENSLKDEKLTIIISPDGGLEIDGQVFLHDQKISDQIRYSLRQHNLLHEGFGDLAGEGHNVVDKRASGLILSCLAARIAQKNGWDTLTDSPLDFALSSSVPSQRLGIDSNSVETALLSAIAQTSIPAEVNDLNLRDYVELREAFSEVRGSFTILASELAQKGRLNRTRDPAVLIPRIQKAAIDFESEWRKYHDTRYSRRFQQFTPLFIGTLVSIPTNFIASNPWFASTSILGSAALQIIATKYWPERVPTRNDECFKMISGVHDKIMPTPLVRKFI